ncbi:carbohydrate esterase family 12 protein [Ceratobasidium sp. AG-Ba]|nr:carbohydrate esterase family 12 protein [Ceratobasidium sp. AG-Ba]
MLFGDSLTQGGWEPNGFAQRLAYVYGRRLDVINRGLSGYNTEWAIPVFEQCFAKSDLQAMLPKVKLLVIWFGANDSTLQHSPQHVPLPKFIENMNTLVDMPTSPTSPWYSPTTRVLLVTAPPINATQRNAEYASRNPPIGPDRTHENTKAYAQAVIDVGKKRGVPVVDLWTALWKAAGETEEGLPKVLPDGLHCNEASYKVLPYEKCIASVIQSFADIIRPHYRGDFRTLSRVTL